MAGPGNEQLQDVDLSALLPDSSKRAYDIRLWDESIHSGRADPRADFSLDLNEDQLQLQKWVHDFAADVVRPVAHEWDEREETPWPIIEEAAYEGRFPKEISRPVKCRSSNA